MLILFASVRIVQMSPTLGRFSIIGLPVPYSYAWAGGFFVLCGALVALFTLGLRTGIEAIDGKTAGFVDLLTETETELKKVSWPSKEELRSSTAVVLACMVVLGVFLFAVDQVVAWLMMNLRVLPEG